MQTKSKIILAVIAIAVIAVLARTYLGRNQESDTVQIQNQLLAAAAAADNKDTAEVMAIISDNYTDDAGNNPEQLELLLHRAMSEVQNLDVNIAPATVTVNGNTAQSNSYMTVKADGQVVLSRLIQLTWQKENTRRFFIIPVQTWRVVKSNYTGDIEGG